MADGCLLLLEDGSGFLLLESAELRLEDGSGSVRLETGDGNLLLEDDTSGRLLLEQCPPDDAASGGWAERWDVRETESDLVVAVIHSLRRRRRLTVG